MIKNQEFEHEFYIEQIQLMSKRYEILFKKNKINWAKYYNYVIEKLNKNPYCMWIFMCGLEVLIKEKELNKKNVYLDADKRTYNIVEKYFKSRDVSNYI